MRDPLRPSRAPLSVQSFDGELGRQIIDLHVWAVDQGLHGAPADALFDGFCQRLVGAGVPLWRAQAGMRTLHPQWGGYTYTWRRDLNAIEPAQFERGEVYEQDVLSSPFASLERQGDASERADGRRRLRRRLAGPDAQLDFPILRRFAAAGATDYLAEVVRFGEDGDPSRGIGIGYSFATDRPEGFAVDAVTLIQAVLPAASLAMMTHASHTIASGLIRGFTQIADASPGLVLIELLDEVFEALAAALRPRGGQVLKFLGDGILVSFPFDDSNRAETCRQALEAAGEAMAALDRVNAARGAAGKPTAAVDLALHLGEVLYGNVGAVDRLDFTVIGPAVNEVARMEALCEPLGRNVLVSAEFAAALGDGVRLQPLGRHALRGVREPREIYAPEAGS